MIPPISDAYARYHDYLKEHVVAPFFTGRLNRLTTLTLNELMQRKNPYLLKAKNLEFPNDVIRTAVDVFLSSQEETVFGDLMEKFAIFVAADRYDGFKSQRKSVDLEFQRNGHYYIVGIKSGINWGNADQVSKMRGNFADAKRDLRAQGYASVIAVNGCIYGYDNQPLKTHKTDPELNYFKYAGQDFWYFIALDDALYRELIRPIDELARQRDKQYKEAYIAKINQLSAEFMERFVVNGHIDWFLVVDHACKRRRDIRPAVD